MPTRTVERSVSPAAIGHAAADGRCGRRALQNHDRLTVWVVAIWLSGVAAVLILLVLGLARIWWLDRLTVPLLDESLLRLTADLSRELGLGRRAAPDCCRQSGLRCR